MNCRVTAKGAWRNVGNEILFPCICRRVRGDDFHILSLREKAQIVIAAMFCLAYWFLILMLEWSLSQWMVTWHAGGRLKTFLQTSYPRSCTAVSRSELVITPLWLLYHTTGYLMSFGHSTQSTVGLHAFNSLSTTLPTPKLEASTMMTESDRSVTSSLHNGCSHINSWRSVLMLCSDRSGLFMCS